MMLVCVFRLSASSGVIPIVVERLRPSVKIGCIVLGHTVGRGEHAYVGRESTVGEGEHSLNVMLGAGGRGGREGETRGTMGFPEQLKVVAPSCSMVGVLHAAHHGTTRSNTPWWAMEMEWMW